MAGVLGTPPVPQPTAQALKAELGSHVPCSGASGAASLAGRRVGAGSCRRSSLPGPASPAVGAQPCAKHVQRVTCHTSGRAKRQDGSLHHQLEPCGRLFPRHPQRRSFPFCSAKCQICFQPVSIRVQVCLPCPSPMGLQLRAELEFQTVLCVGLGTPGLAGSPPRCSQSFAPFLITATGCDRNGFP